MPREKPDETYLWDMLKAAESAIGFCQGKTFDHYLADALLRSAVERKIEIIGEASRHISDSFKTTHPEVPWKKITRQRHVLAHDYDEVQHDLLWKVLTIHLPELVEQLRKLVPPAPDQKN